MVKFVVRTVATGFCVALGTALFKKVAPHLGLADKKDKPADKDKESEQVTSQEGAVDPGLRLS